MKDYGMTKVDEGELIAPNAQAPVNQTFFEMDVQSRSARAHRREIEVAVKECKALVQDREIAESMTYALERYDRKTGKTKVIRGPSIRCAELIAYAWGNIRFAGNIIEVGARSVLAEGLAIDLERNNAARVTASRRIVGKNGVRYSDDMIELTSAVAQSIAIRNAILKVIPGAFVKQVLDEAENVIARGSGETSKRFDAALRWAASEGISEEEVLAFLGIPSASEVRPSDLNRLLQVANAIREGEATADDVFRGAARRAATEEAEKISTPEKSKAQEAVDSFAEPLDDEEPEPAPKPARARFSADELDERARARDPEPKKRRVAPKKEKEELQLAARNSIDEAKVALSKHLGDSFSEVWTLVYEAGLADDSEALVAITRAPKPIVLACLRDAEPEAALRTIVETASRR